MCYFHYFYFVKDFFYFLLLPAKLLWIWNTSLHFIGYDKILKGVSKLKTQNKTKNPLNHLCHFFLLGIKVSSAILICYDNIIITIIYLGIFFKNGKKIASFFHGYAVHLRIRCRVSKSLLIEGREGSTKITILIREKGRWILPHEVKNTVSAFQISCKLLSFTLRDSRRN